MKKTLFLALMLVIGATAFAQQQMATLNHNDTITVFYGPYALKDAHNAAVAGDIVTLSPGTFEECDITKPITLRGAGATIDTIAGTYPTVITGNFNLDIPKHTEYYLVIEGVYMSQTIDINKLYNAKFNRCNIYKLSFGVSSHSYDPNKEIAENVEFVNCLIREIGNGFQYSSTSSFTFVNCALYWHSYEVPSTFINSLLIITTNFSKSTAYNSVITRIYGSCFTQTANAFNSIFIRNGSGSNIFENTTNNTNVTYNNLNEVFETWHSCTDSNFSFDERYILKEEIATSFLGSDGTEVGIHGGLFPFDTRPSYMVVKKCNVANKSTIDGKLSVDIEVMVEE